MQFFVCFRWLVEEIFSVPKISAHWNLPNKSPQFRLIKRTSRAIYNLQSFVCFVLIYMNDVFRFFVDRRSLSEVGFADGTFSN